MFVYRIDEKYHSIRGIFPQPFLIPAVCGTDTFAFLHVCFPMTRGISLAPFDRGFFILREKCVRTTVVCGLLGSGKTTFIKNSLQGLREKTVVLVNDFGAAGIDGEIFSAGGIESVELPSGCVCCTLKPDLISTIQKIVREFAPGHLVIEPSGIAAPSAVLEAVQSAGVNRCSVIGIVDVTEFSELYHSGMYGSFFEDQIRVSDVILVNKTDLAEEHNIREAMNCIEAINPWSILFRTVNARLLQPLVDSITEAGKSPARPTRHVKDADHAHFYFETLS